MLIGRGDRQNVIGGENETREIVEADERRIKAEEQERITCHNLATEAMEISAS